MKTKLALLILFLCLLPSGAWASLSIEPSIQPDEDGRYHITGNGVYTLTTNGAEINSPIYLDSLVDEDYENHLIVTLQDFKTVSDFKVRGNVTLILKEDNVLGMGLSYESDYYEAPSEAFSSALTIDGDGSLTAIGEEAPENLDDEPSYYASAGIELTGGYRPQLIIKGGTIHATGGYGHAGIGGYNAHVTIHDGAITAVGGYGSAGIGGDKNEDWMDDNDTTILIHGGSVTAEGGYGGAGIGNSAFIPQTEYFESESSASISITGGTVNAKGGIGGAGIGGSGEVYISVTGGEIESAQGGVGDDTLGGGAGIGGNHNGSATVYISGGIISASGGSRGAGIGGGEYGDGCITILDGTITAQSEHGAGIGGNTALIAINGGTIHASSSMKAIGCSSYETVSGSISIFGGTITAISDGDAAIYSDLILINGGHITAFGYHGILGDVIINGGVIYAKASSSNAPGIGGLWNDITINGGIIFSEGGSGIEGNHILITGGQIGSKDSIGEKHYYTGINGKHITITGGDIFVKGGVEVAGIGACWEDHCDLRITGGTITAYGYEHDASSDYTAGIGNGRSSSDIVIDGGTIYAYGGSGIKGNTITINDGIIYAYGVGDGYRSSGGIYGDHLIISGGTIEASCSGIGSGIGLGSCFRYDYGFDYGYDTELIITGGNITATGGNFSAGIGNSYDYEIAYPIRISGGNIQATGGYHAAGIGGGAGSDCDVTISGGTIHAIGGEDAPGVGPGSEGEISNYGESLRSGSGPVFIQADDAHPLELWLRHDSDSEWTSPNNNPITSVYEVADYIKDYNGFKLVPLGE